MSEGEAVDIGLSLAQKDVPERSPLVAAEREFKSSISARDLAHFDKLYRRGKTERISKEYARFSEKKTAELQDLLDRGKINTWEYTVNVFEIKGLGYVTEAVEPESAHEQAIAVLTLLAGNSREKNYPKTQEHYTFYKDKRFTSDVQQYFFDTDRDLHYSFLGTRAFSSLALRGLHIINEATEHDAVKLSFLIDEYTKVVAPDTDKKTEIALGILETTTNLGVSTSYERNLSQNAAWIVVQDYMQLRGLGKEETELMFSTGLRNVVRNWVKHEYVNPYCLNSINDYLWDNAAHGGLYALREKYERAESNRGPSHYEVVDPGFVRRWNHQVEGRGGLRFLIKDRADRETGMGQEAVKRYDPNYPEVYLRDKAKHDELLALAGVGVDVKKRGLLYGQDSLKAQLSQFVGTEKNQFGMQLEDRMDYFNQELKVMMQALLADRSMPEKLRVTLTKFTSSKAEFNYDSIKNNPFLVWVGYLPDGVHGYLELLKNQDPLAQEGLFLAMRATAVELQRTFFKQNDETNYAFGLHAPPSTTRVETSRVMRELEDKKYALAHQEFAKPVEVDEYFDRQVRGAERQASLFEKRFGMYENVSRTGDLATSLSTGAKQWGDFFGFAGEAFGRDKKKALKRTALVSTAVIGFSYGAAFAITEVGNYIVETVQASGLVETPAPTPDKRELKAAPSTPISENKKDQGLTSIEDPTGPPVVAAEVLHLPESLHGQYLGFVPFGYDVHDRNKALDGKLKYDKPVGNVQIIPLHENMQVSFSSEEFALSFPSQEYLYLPDNIEVTEIIQHGGAAPKRNALGALRFDRSDLPKRIIVKGKMKDIYEVVPGTKMRIIGKDASLNYAPVVDIKGAHVLSDTLTNDPELHSLLAQAAEDSSEPVTTTDRMLPIWHRMAAFEQVMNHRHYSLRLSSEVKPGPYSGIGYLDTYGSFYCNTAGLITTQFAQLNGFPAIMRGGALFAVNAKNELYNHGVYHQVPVFISPDGFIITHDNTPSPLRSPDREEAHTELVATPVTMEEQDLEQVRSIIFQALEEDKAAQAARQKKEHDDLLRKQMLEGIENTARSVNTGEYVIAGLLLAGAALAAHPRSRKAIRGTIAESITRFKTDVSAYRAKRKENAVDDSVPIENLGDSAKDLTVVSSETLPDTGAPVSRLQAETSAAEPEIILNVPRREQEQTLENVPESDLLVTLAGGIALELATDPESESEVSPRLRSLIHRMANFSAEDISQLQDIVIARQANELSDVPEELQPFVDLVDLQQWVKKLDETMPDLQLPYSARNRAAQRRNAVVRLLDTELRSASDDSLGKLTLTLVRKVLH